MTPPAVTPTASAALAAIDDRLRRLAGTIPLLTGREIEPVEQALAEIHRSIGRFHARIEWLRWRTEQAPAARGPR